MAQHGRPGIFGLVEELVQEQVDGRAERVEGKVPDVLAEREDGKRDGEG
jgi:hypothetical protein